MKLKTILVLFLLPLIAVAQQHEIYSPSVRSLQVKAGDDWLSPPIIRLNGDVEVNIDFDDLTHTYRRYAYRLQHCEADWTPSEEIFTSDYCEGFVEGNLIEDMAMSVNTNHEYTHYHLSLPNEQCRMKISGNYKLTVYDDDSQDDVLTACFMVTENLMPLGMQMTTATDMDIRGRHQQLEIALDYGQTKVTNPSQEVSIQVAQNACWNSSVWNPDPQFTSTKGLEWSHCRPLIFDGGNEYHKFETLQTSNVGLGIERMGWDGTDYHAYLWTDQPRLSYVFDQDANGAYLVRNWDGRDNDETSEYILVHFTLQTPKTDAPIYIDGEWTNHQYEPQYELVYNDSTQLYESTQLLKQGYYSYRYVRLAADGRPIVVPSEGNFYQTENRYQCLVYYRPIGARTHRLVAYKQISTKTD